MGTLRGYLFLLVAVVKASEDLSHMLQRELTLSELLDMDPEYLEQKLVSSEISDGVKMHETVQSGRPRVGPRSMGPHIPFPPARPTRSNLQAICRDGNRRPRYPKDILPSTGFGFLQRQAEAINQLESWFAKCCSTGTQDEQLTLCCVQQAWEESLSAFCEAEFMVKTSHYQCCKKKESEKWQCFEKNAPDESYQASGQQLWTNIPAPNFNFKPSTCQKTGSVVNPRTIREKGIPDISFPLGRPTSANIGFICANQKRRPRYASKCLPSSGYAWLARQSKAINGLERSLSRCCKRKDEQACAEKEWKKMVDKFCKDEKKAKANQFDCCKKEKGEELYDCFAAAAPNPDYILEDDSGAPSQAHPTLDMLCNKENVTHQRKSLLDAAFVADQCCPMVEEKRPACFQMELHKLQNQLCNDDRNILGCCLKKDKSRTKCFTKMLLQNIPDTIRISRTKKCPISS